MPSLETESPQPLVEYDIEEASSLRPNINDDEDEDEVAELESPEPTCAEQAAAEDVSCNRRDESTVESLSDVFRCST